MFAFFSMALNVFKKKNRHAGDWFPVAPAPSGEGTSLPRTRGAAVHPWPGVLAEEPHVGHREGWRKARGSRRRESGVALGAVSLSAQA